MSAEEQYSTFNQELLACYASINHFWQLLDGVQFLVRCDQRLVFQALVKKMVYEILQQAWQLLYLSEFNIKLDHLPGGHVKLACSCSYLG